MNNFTEIKENLSLNSAPAPQNLNYNYNYGIFGFIIVFVMSIISFISPTLMFFFLVVGSILVLIFLFPSLFNALIKQDIVVSLLIFLHKIQFLPYVAYLHFVLFYKISNKMCYSIIWGCNIMTVIYAATTRYYIYQTLVLNNHFTYYNQLFIFFILFLGIYTVYYKLLINISIILISFCRRYQKDLLDIIILTVEPGDFPNSSHSGVSQDSNPNARTFNLFNLNRNSSSHHYFTPLPKFTTWQKGGIVAACLTCGFSAGALYYTRRNTLAAEQSAIAAQQSAVAAQQSAIAAQQTVDLAEVTAGIRTVDSYKQKWVDSTITTHGSSGSPSFYEEYLFNIPFSYYNNGIFALFALILTFFIVSRPSVLYHNSCLSERRVYILWQDILMRLPNLPIS